MFQIRFPDKNIVFPQKKSLNFQIRFPEQKHWISSNLHILSHFKLELVDMCTSKVSNLVLLFVKHDCLQIIPLGLIGTQFNFPTWFDSSTSVILRRHSHSASIVNVLGISKKSVKWHSWMSVGKQTNFAQEFFSIVNREGGDPQWVNIMWEGM